MAVGPESGEEWASEQGSAPLSPCLEEMRREEEEQRREDEEEEETGGNQALLLEGHPMDVPALGMTPNCERLSPQSLLDGPEDEAGQLDTIFIEPLEGSQAELRGRVIKEVRKPGRSEGTCCFYSHLPVSEGMKSLVRSQRIQNKIQKV